MAVPGNVLPKAELTQSGRPILQINETEVYYLSNIDLTSDNTTQTLILKSSTLILTTHRLLFLPETTTSTAAETAASAIPLGSIVHIFPAKKSIKAMFASPRVRFQVTGLWPGPSVVVTVVVRGKGDFDVFVEKFWANWRARAWESDVVSESADKGKGSGSGGFDSSGMRVVGVAGILRREQEIWESTDKSLQDAFQDLNALMSKAKEMVMLAEKMRQKLLSGSNSHGGTPNDEEMGSKEEMQDWLLSVGIVSPVTKESAGALYHQQLSRQLADFVRIPLERAGGMMNLIDIYCLFNRARGTELISPEDLLQACAIWEKIDVPVMLRKFDSGVKVIQNKSHSDEEVFARIKSLALKPDALRTGVSESDAAMTLGVAPAMAKEHLLSAESKGLLCRDLSPDGFRFFVNVFPDISLDDMYLVQDDGVYTTWIKAVAV